MSRKRDHQPISEQYSELMNGIAAAIDQGFNGDKRGKDRTVGFTLLIFELGEAGPDSRVNYISNAERADMLVAMKEFIARAEGRYAEAEEGAKQ